MKRKVAKQKKLVKEIKRKLHKKKKEILFTKRLRKYNANRRKCLKTLSRNMLGITGEEQKSLKREHEAHRKSEKFRQQVEEELRHNRERMRIERSIKVASGLRSLNKLLETCFLLLIRPPTLPILLLNILWNPQVSRIELQTLKWWLY